LPPWAGLYWLASVTAFSAPTPDLVEEQQARATTVTCRDRRTWPFDAKAIWNIPIGSGAVYHDAKLYPETVEPDGSMEPGQFLVDTDHFVATTASDPMTPFIQQGWWGNDAECGKDHCCIKKDAATHGMLPFPKDTLIGPAGSRLQGGNNAAAVLLPDKVTLVQFQPFYRCTAGGPLLAESVWFDPERSSSMPQLAWANVSILDAVNASYGAHGGSKLSSIGGTVRKGELLPNAPPIRHAIKIMLWAKQYYFPGNVSVPCFRWPALTCDGFWNASRDPSNPNFYNGTDPNLKPGALLAVPPTVADAIFANITTPVGKKLLAVLTDYGGYIDDNSASNSGAFNVEDGVEDEVAGAYNGQTLQPSKGQDPLYTDMLAIWRSLHYVNNNGPNSVGGGGTPRQPLAPPICPV